MEKLKAFHMSSRGKTNAALAAAIIFLFLSSAAAYFAFARLRASERWVQHTRDVQNILHQFSAMANRASRLRAEYVDSGDESVLQRQQEAVREVRSQLADVQRLTNENSDERDVNRRLAAVTEQRISLMNQAIELKRTGKSTLAAQASISHELVAAADRSDELMQGMHQAEQQLLMQREHHERTSFKITVAILAGSLLLALILFLIHHQLLTDQVRERLRAEASLRALSARLMSLQDEERRRFARELHDSVGQQLVAMKLAVASLEEKLHDDATVQDLFAILDECIKETRTISHLLHPPLLDEAGLKSALRWFVEGFGKRSGIEVNVEFHDAAERLPDSIELVLFRVLQESLTNVHRHSGATRADVSLSVAKSVVFLKIKDHGRGMPPALLERLGKDGAGGGVGLAGMTQRIREIGGRLGIQSSSAGTEILVSVPLPRGYSLHPPSRSGLQRAG